MDWFRYIYPLIDLRKGLMDNRDAKLNLSNRVGMLNPNAAEFIPSALRATARNTSSVDTSRLGTPMASGKAVLDRSESSVSSNSDDEVHQYWRRQLPDDITPDFKSMAEDALKGSGHLPLTNLSIHDGIETARYSVSSLGQPLGTQQEISPLRSNTTSSQKFSYTGSSYVDNHLSTDFMTRSASFWDKHFINEDQYFSNRKEGRHYNGESAVAFLDNLFGDHTDSEDIAINPVDILVSQFPGFSATSLAEVYYANGCDLNLTIEMLTQLELQVDGGFSQNPNQEGLTSPSFSISDFPALSVPDAHDGLPKYAVDDVQQACSTFRPSISQGAIDFASAVRKLASQDSGHWNYEKIGPVNSSAGSNRRSQLLPSSYNGHEKLIGEKLRSLSAARAAPVWLETGEAVANMYSESRGEARDFARLRNACFEQARQAYLIGNKALAKELSSKGQSHNMKMKEAHGKAREAIYRQRNPVAIELQGYGRGQDRLIDLHGLHVTEALHVLRHELSILRGTARSAGKRLQVMICVGTGHHTKGTRTPARLPVAVEQYLLEEGLHYSQPQPGLLRVLIY